MLNHQLVESYPDNVLYEYYLLHLLLVFPLCKKHEVTRWPESLTYHLSYVNLNYNDLEILDSGF